MFLKIPVQIVGLLEGFVKKYLSQTAGISQISGSIITLDVPVRLCQSAVRSGHNLGSGVVPVCEHQLPYENMA